MSFAPADLAGGGNPVANRIRSADARRLTTVEPSAPRPPAELGSAAAHAYSKARTQAVNPNERETHAEHGHYGSRSPHCCPGGAFSRPTIHRMQRTARLWAWLACWLLSIADLHAQTAPTRSAKGYELAVVPADAGRQSGALLRRPDQRRIALVNTMFTSCQAICPPMTANLAKVQKGLGKYMGKQASSVSISVDPEVDTPAVLKRYADRFGIGPGWIFLTGAGRCRCRLAKIGDGDPTKPPQRHAASGR